MLTFILLAMIIIPLSIPLIAILVLKMNSPLKCNSRNQCIYESMGNITKDGKTLVAMGCAFCGHRVDVEKDEAEVMVRMSMYTRGNRFRSRVFVGNE